MSERSPSAAKERAGVQSRDTSLPLPDAFDAWCAETGGGTDLEAFRAGFGYGHDRGWENALAWARRNVEATGRIDG